MTEDALLEDAFQDFDLSSSPLGIMKVDRRATAQAALDAACVVIAEQHATQTMHDVMYKTGDFMHTPPLPLHFHPPRQVRRTRLLSKRKTKKNVVWMPQSAKSAVAHSRGYSHEDLSKTPTSSRVINLTYPALEPASRSRQTTSRTRFVREYACFEDTTHRASV